MKLSRFGVIAFLAWSLAEPSFAESRGKVRKSRPAPKLNTEESQPQAPSLDNILDADLQSAWAREARTRWTAPSLGVTAPGGFGADWGTIYGGVFFASTTLGQKPIADGVVFAGFGLGNATDIIGAEVTYTVTDLDPFLADSVLGFKVHRQLGRGFAVSVGLESAIVFGEGVDGVANPYLAASKYFMINNSEFAWFSSAIITAGIGQGRFRQWQDQLDGKKTIGVFGSAGVRVLAPLGISMAWSGYGLDAGLSVAPFRSFRLTINLGYHNIVATEPTLPKVFDISLVYADSFFEDTFPFFTIRTNR